MGSDSCPSSPKSFSKKDLLGMLRIRVIRGINLAIRDSNTSDPYVVIEMGKQKVKTHVVKKNVNPEWNEELTLCVLDPNLLVNLTVYDKDKFNQDDKMGVAEFGIKSFIDAAENNWEGIVPSGTVITRVTPDENTYLAEDSCILFLDGKVIQNMCLQLKKVESGSVVLQLQWIDLPRSLEILKDEEKKKEKEKKKQKKKRKKQFKKVGNFLGSVLGAGGEEKHEEKEESSSDEE